MASRLRSISRPALSFINHSAKSSSRSLCPNALPRPSTPLQGVPQGLRSLSSLLPLHSAVSSARLTSRLGFDSARSLYQGLGCSIDMEPRTLNGGELKSAIVAAVDVIQSKDPNEASSIFTEGMKAVVSIKGMEKKLEKRDQIHKLVEKSYKEGSAIHGGSWDSHCTNSNPDHSALIEECCGSVKKREPLSSPF